VGEGLKTTFALLAKTDNEAAVRVLLPALDSPYAAVRDGALEAIVSRRSPEGHREILRRLDRLDASWHRIIAAHSHRMAPTLREAVLGDDLALCCNACRAAVWFREYELVPALITVLETPLSPASDLAGRTLGELVGILCHELASPVRLYDRRDPQVVRGHLLSSLELSIKRFAGHRRREVVEAFLLLAARDNLTLKQVLRDPLHPAFSAVTDVLGKSQQGSVIWLLLSFLEEPQAPAAAISLISRRSDPRFVRALLQKTGREVSAVVFQNLKRIDSFAWLKSAQGLLDQLDEQAQKAAVRLVMNSGVPRARAFETIRYLLLHGNEGGRRAASEALEAFQGAEANELALLAADDEDPQVQANVLVQLRRRGIPGAVLRLVEMLDSPHPVVRKAARKSLVEFTFKRFLAAFDMLDEEVRRSTGALVRKVDAQTIPLLKLELESKIRKRRLRALAMARAIGVEAELESAIIERLQDEDHLIRAEAAAALGRLNTPSARRALSQAMEDRSQAVQEAARRSLAENAGFDRVREALFDPRD